MKWQPIESAPKPSDWLSIRQGTFLLASFWQPTNEDGEADGPLEMSWSATAYLTASGWMVPTNSIAGTHGYASFKARENATHYIRLDELEFQS